tara:strand:+ start:294 stop:947 length:654 start_codon:yes stop_codon:yes gene_type:complete
MCLSPVGIQFQLRGFALLELMTACALMALLASSSVQVILWQAGTVNRVLQQPRPQLALQSLALQIGRDLSRSHAVKRLTSPSLKSCFILSTVTSSDIGYRLHKGALQYHGDAFDCAQRGWQSLSAPHSLQLTRFDILTLPTGYQVFLATATDKVQLPLVTSAPATRSTLNEQLYDPPSVTDWHTCIDHAPCRRATESVVATFRLAMAAIPTTATARL